LAGLAYFVYQSRETINLQIFWHSGNLEKKNTFMLNREILPPTTNAENNKRIAKNTLGAVGG